MGLRIQLSANADIFFRGWAQYLRARITAGSDISLCRVLNENSAALRKRVASSANKRVARAKNALDEARSAGEDTAQLEARLADLKEQLKQIEQRAAFPWLTPVLGSGCLSTSDQLGDPDVAGVPAKLAEAAKPWGSVFSGGDGADDLVFQFTANLVRSRVRNAREIAAVDAAGDLIAEPDPMLDTELAARAAIVAALSVRLFHRISALANQPIRDARTEVRLASDDYDFGNIMDQVIEPLLEHLRTFAHAAKEHPELEFLVDYLEQVGYKIGREGIVTLANAQLLTEITWHLMTRKTARYTGWTDLLFLIGIKSRGQSPDRRSPILTDLGDPDGLRSWLIEGLQETTEQSWRSRQAQASANDRENFYDAIAAVITEQAKLDDANKNRPPDQQFPPAVAYVTSFDLELEMALHWSGTTFVLVVPFEVWRGTGESRRASLVWFYRIVHAADAPEGRSSQTLRESKDWHVLRKEAMRDTDSPLAGKPVVVRLTGCPLVELPVIDGDPEAEQFLDGLVFAKKGGKQKGEDPHTDVEEFTEFEVGHAALLDEHTGLHHWTAEVQETLRLPGELVGNRAEPHIVENMDRRFWLLLGVQIPDDAVRHRVAALVAAESIRGLVPNAEYETPRAGVVVNRRSEPAHRDILQWQGLDVVEDEHTAVVKALRHYTRHLVDPTTRPVGNGRCEVGPNDEVR